MPSQILKNESKPAHELCVEKDLSSYSRFTRDKWVCLQTSQLQAADTAVSYGQFMTLFSKTVAERTKPGQRQDVEEKCMVFNPSSDGNVLTVPSCSVHLSRLRPHGGRCRHHHLRRRLSCSRSAPAAFQSRRRISCPVPTKRLLYVKPAHFGLPATEGIH